MSANAATLPCPICLHTGVFDSAQSLRDKLILVSTNNLTCPVCQEEVCGLDKLTIHLFRHVKLPTTVKPAEHNENSLPDSKVKLKTEVVAATQPKKSTPSSDSAKNKTLVSASATMKYVKIYPKLPVIAMNTATTIDAIQCHTIEESKQARTSVQVPIVKSEILSVQTNTTCNLCGLQFIDANILKMHRCLVHNIDENSNQNCTRYYCHLCPKNFKMRGSLMVHLRVAHFGFPGKSSSENQNNSPHEKKSDQPSDDKPINPAERNDNKQWQCDVCRKCFTTKYFLKKHKRLHTGETPYACSQCNKTFTFQQSYHKHLLYHNDEKPHTCSQCGRAFKELSTLHNHQRIHTGEKPFSCETCGKCFRQRVSYLVHRRIHTGVMPYKCTACNKSFRYKVSQRTHKCQAQPPGTVVRQTGDLVEKLKKKHINDPVCNTNEKISPSDPAPCFEVQEQPNYIEISESNAELVRRGAKLSLEDMESESFTLIGDHLFGNTNDAASSSTIYSAGYDNSTLSEGQNSESHIEDLIESIPVIVDDNNLPSPSEIFKNLCLSAEENCIGIIEESHDNRNYDNCKNLNDYL